MLMGGDRSSYWNDNRLPIVSFNVHFDAPGGDKRFVHAHFIAALLNDLYGIQARSGCSCAGPYGMRLIDLERSEVDYLRQHRDCEPVKPGWARVNFTYTLTEEECEFVIEAVEQVAEHGWKLLPLYAMNAKTGQFQHRSFDRMDSVDFIGGLQLSSKGWIFQKQPEVATPRKEYLKQAMVMYDKAHEFARDYAHEILHKNGDFVDGNKAPIDPVIEWVKGRFVLASDAVRRMQISEREAKNNEHAAKPRESSLRAGSILKVKSFYNATRDDKWVLAGVGGATKSSPSIKHVPSIKSIDAATLTKIAVAVSDRRNIVTGQGSG